MYYVFWCLYTPISTFWEGICTGLTYFRSIFMSKSKTNERVSRKKKTILELEFLLYFK